MGKEIKKKEQGSYIKKNDFIVKKQEIKTKETRRYCIKAKLIV